MTHEPTRCSQRIFPYLAYANAGEALDFLANAFGFEETSRMAMPDGRIGHAEVALGDNVLWLASTYPELGFASPQDLDSVHSQVVCYVDDVDAHYARARAAGAVLVDAPRDTDHGDRRYRALDPEGHRWIFASRISELASRTEAA